ncbi:HNMT [Branchiostoma lanceolatum]|uniref:HNMT protein n=1 Tax=Branchiostoma lanceolatum TaxID=7740 RepID=A0A8S4MNS9_BRALA|nr:HNMT [Branchiostoma lanceolatum]
MPDSTLCESGVDVRVLGIGSGAGGIDCVILKKLLQRHSGVYNRVIEPSKDMIEQYKALLGKDTGLRSVKFDWRQQTAEEYFQAKADTQFNLIHAMHALYYVEDINAALRNMWEQLADGGYMLVAMESDESDWGTLQHKLWEEFGRGDRLASPFRMSGDIKQWFDTKGISYVTFKDETRLNVSKCFKEHSETGNLLLDFLTHTPYVADEPEVKSMVLDYIRCNSSEVDEKMLFQSITETTVAFKRCTEEK